MPGATIVSRAKMQVGRVRMRDKIIMHSLQPASEVSGRSSARTPCVHVSQPTESAGDQSALSLAQVQDEPCDRPLSHAELEAAAMIFQLSVCLPRPLGLRMPGK